MSRSAAPGPFLVNTAALGLAVLVLIGLLLALLRVAGQDYVHHGAWNLVLLTLQRSIDRYALVFLAAAAVALAGLSASLLAGTDRRLRGGRDALAAGWVLVAAGLAFAAFLWLELARVGVPAERLLERIGGRGLVLRLGPAVACLAGLALGAHLLAWLAGSTRPLQALGERNRPVVRGLGLAAAIAVVLLNLAAFGWFRLRAQHGPNVILISIDTLRADHLAAYGHPDATSPALDAFAGEALLFENCVSQAPWTLPSMATMHTGSYPWQHRANHLSRRLDRREFMLAEAFRNALYRTIGVVSHIFVGRNYGFQQGFDTFNDDHVRGPKGLSSVQLTDTAIGYLREAAGDPFFLWVHYFDPHYDYIRHDDYPSLSDGYAGDLGPVLTIDELVERQETISGEDLQYVRQVYDSEIWFTDRQIERLLDAVEQLGLAENTVVAVTADHGEEFLDRDGFGHGKRVYQPLVGVPLLLRDPRTPESHGRRVVDPVEVRYLPRTLLEAAGLDSSSFSGLNLLRLAAGEEDPLPVFSEGSYARGTDSRKFMIRRDAWKLIHNLDDDTLELYDLRSDPGERDNLYAEDHPVAVELLAAMRQRVAELGPGRGAAAEISDAERERLRSLGYIQ